MKQLPLDLQQHNFKEMEAILEGLRASLGPDNYEQKKLKLQDAVRKGDITLIFRSENQK